MTNPTANGFKVALVSELPEKWQTAITVTQHTADMLHCDISDIGMAVTFSAPQCPLSMAYQAWLTTQNNKDMVGITIENAAVWAETAGPGGVLEFERSMRVDRRPSFEHLVRVHWIKSMQK